MVVLEMTLLCEQKPNTPRRCGRQNEPLGADMWYGPFAGSCRLILWMAIVIFAPSEIRNESARAHALTIRGRADR